MTICENLCPECGFPWLWCECDSGPRGRTKFGINNKPVTNVNVTQVMIKDDAGTITVRVSVTDTRNLLDGTLYTLLDEISTLYSVSFDNFLGHTSA